MTDDILKFGQSNSSTLVKVGYHNQIPKVEICNEYVPEIRGDQRVNVIYPIYKEQTNIRRGIFIGDKSTPPSEVMFDNVGGCYVRPLEGYRIGDKLSELYYIDGAFYTTNMGIDISDVKLKFQDHYIDFEGGSKYAVVKIGSGYWTRQNIKDELEFGEPVDPDDPNCYDYNTYEVTEMVCCMPIFSMVIHRLLQNRILVYSMRMKIYLVTESIGMCLVKRYCSLRKVYWYEP